MTDKTDIALAQGEPSEQDLSQALSQARRELEARTQVLQSANRRLGALNQALAEIRSLTNAWCDGGGVQPQAGICAREVRAILKRYSP